MKTRINQIATVTLLCLFGTAHAQTQQNLPTQLDAHYESNLILSWSYEYTKPDGVGGGNPDGSTRPDEYSLLYERPDGEKSYQDRGDEYSVLYEKPDENRGDDRPVFSQVNVEFVTPQTVALNDLDDLVKAVNAEKLNTPTIQLAYDWTDAGEDAGYW